MKDRYVLAGILTFGVLLVTSTGTFDRSSVLQEGVKPGKNVPLGSTVIHDDGVTTIKGASGEVLMRANDSEARKMAHPGPSSGGEKAPATHIFEVPSGSHVDTEGNVTYIYSSPGEEKLLLRVMMDGPENRSGVYAESSYAHNISDDRVLVGFSDNVFIGRVIEKTGSESNTPPPEADSPGFSPQTQFSVEVLENVKGNLSGTVTVSQYGGYEELFGVEVPFWKNLVDGDELLRSGQTYLFVTRYNERDGWHSIVANNYGDLPIQNQTDYEKKLERFEEAYRNEIPPETSRRRVE